MNPFQLSVFSFSLEIKKQAVVAVQGEDTPRLSKFHPKAANSRLKLSPKSSSQTLQKHKAHAATLLSITE